MKTTKTNAMLPGGRAKCMIVNNTDCRLLVEMEIYLVAHAMRGEPLPEAYFDCFDVKVIEVDGQRRAVVNWR